MINDKLYNLDVNLGKNTDNQKPPSMDLSLIFSEESKTNYIIRGYKVKDISPCSEEYKFNINNGTRAFRLNIECILSEKYNNIIPCQSNMETPNMNFSMNDDFSLDENKLIYISADKDYNFPLFSYEKPPIVAIIFITSIFCYL